MDARKDTHNPCLTISFVIVSKWKQPKYLSVKEWINLLHSHVNTTHTVTLNELELHSSTHQNNVNHNLCTRSHLTYSNTPL